MTVTMSTLANAPIAPTRGAPNEQPGAIGLDNAQDYLNRVIKELRVQGAEKKGALVTVLEYLSLHISRTRDQIGTLRVGGSRPNPLSATADQLEEVVGETARAAHDIISAAEEIERLATKVAPEVAQALNAAVIRIYEASAFQDISGQRIAKAIGALQFIDARIVELMQACGPLPVAPEPAKSSDDELLNGPQLASDATRQNEIDKLFGAV
jgi:chemotaxis protein CheZ